MKKQFTFKKNYVKIDYAIKSIKEFGTNKEIIMPNIKSAKKRVLVTEKKTMQNKAIKSALKTQIKKYLAAIEAGDKEAANVAYLEAVKNVEKAEKTNNIHKNNANNRKAKLALKLNALN